MKSSPELAKGFVGWMIQNSPEAVKCKSKEAKEKMEDWIKDSIPPGRIEAVKVLKQAKG